MVELETNIENYFLNKFFGIFNLPKIIFVLKNSFADVKNYFSKTMQICAF